MIIFNEHPILLQWFPHFNHGVVIGINRFGQILLLVAGIMALYQERIINTLPEFLKFLAYQLRRYAAEFGWQWTESSCGITFPPEAPILYEELKNSNDFSEVIFSIILLIFLTWYFGKSPFELILLPFSIGWRELSILSFATLNIWTSIKALLILISFFPTLLFIALLVLVILQPIAYLFSTIANRVSDGSYRLSIAILFICGSILVLIAT